MRTVLCLGGLDPAGRAGLLADARAVEAMGARALCVPTALTFQSSRRVDGYHALTAEVLRAQLAPLLRDESIDAVKVGQLGSPGAAQVVASLPAHLPMVLDTPLVSSSGAALFPESQVAEAYGPLVRRASLVTPNAPEADVLAGLLDGLPVLLKGGHRDGTEVVDVLTHAGTRHEFRSARLPGRFRGTGCRLASAIAARLACGDGLVEAVGRARAWLVSQLEQAA